MGRGGSGEAMAAHVAETPSEGTENWTQQWSEPQSTWWGVRAGEHLLTLTTLAAEWNTDS